MKKKKDESFFLEIKITEIEENTSNDIYKIINKPTMQLAPKKERLSIAFTFSTIISSSEKCSSNKNSFLLFFYQKKKTIYNNVKYISLLRPSDPLKILP